MVLYSGRSCAYSHSTRIVLFEKEVECEIRYLDRDGVAGELADVNPYNETPTLIDRDLVLYGAAIINEYLDERLPHPPLMPIDPINRARARLMIARVQRDWYGLLDSVAARDKRAAERARQGIRDGLIAISPVLSDQQFILNDEYSLVDSYLAPLLWRLPALGVELPRQAKALSDYARRLFERPAFAPSLSDLEREMRQGFLY
jgi:stringent starvation protein A